LVKINSPRAIKHFHCDSFRRESTNNHAVHEADGLNNYLQNEGGNSTKSLISYSMGVSWALAKVDEFIHPVWQHNSSLELWWKLAS
jgi:hypothetical protein